MSYMGMGVMSGPSGDGLDVCCAEFTGDDDTDVWGYKMLKTQTYRYTDEWSRRIQQAPSLNGFDLLKLHVDYGHMVGRLIQEFIEENNYAGVQFIGCHGHTVFHRPKDGVSFQLGDGETISTYVNAIVITDFRIKDLAVGGQGAPLTPIGEKHLFDQYNMFLNLGGICSISTGSKAYDVCPFNLLLNYLAKAHDNEIEFDEKGDIASGGTVVETFLAKLNMLPYCKESPPRTLGGVWFQKELMPLLKQELKVHPAKDLLRTATEHIAIQIVKAIKDTLPNDAAEPVRVENRLLMTGGGALNFFFVDILRQKIQNENLFVSLIDTDEDTVLYKEALIFAFMGLRALLSLTNVQQDLTGAEKDTVCGSLHLPPGGVPPNLLSTDQFSFSFRRRSSTAGSLAIPNSGSFSGGGLTVIDDGITLELPRDSRASWPGLGERRPRS